MIKTVELENKEQVFSILSDVKKKAKDMRPYFEAIISDYFKSNNALIFSASPGKYADLKPSTKKRKQRKVGFVYPILVEEGVLRGSMTNRNDPNAVIRNKPMELELGTSDPKAKWLQEGTRHMPARQPLLINVGNRQKRWERILAKGFEKGVQEATR